MDDSRTKKRQWEICFDDVDQKSKVEADYKKDVSCWKGLSFAALKNWFEDVKCHARNEKLLSGTRTSIRESRNYQPGPICECARKSMVVPPPRLLTRRRTLSPRRLVPPKTGRARWPRGTRMDEFGVLKGQRDGIDVDGPSRSKRSGSDDDGGPSWPKQTEDTIDEGETPRSSAIKPE